MDRSRFLLTSLAGALATPLDGEPQDVPPGAASVAPTGSDGCEFS